MSAEDIAESLGKIQALLDRLEYAAETAPYNLTSQAKTAQEAVGTPFRQPRLL